MFLDGKTFTADSSRSTEINRGAYLVEGPGHCAECHSPRNLMGGIDASRRFAGGSDPEGEGWVPNITPSKDGIGGWSLQDITFMLEIGQTPSGDSVGGSMTEVITNTAALPAADRKAMAAYLKALPARQSTRPKGKKE
jgi:mono/diheme cytochrome c family protein